MNGNGRVELPVVAGAAKVTSEDSEAQVLKHTISHEIGHAIGAAGINHLSDPNGLMYSITPNWRRDVWFSDQAKANILIHNGP